MGKLTSFYVDCSELGINLNNEFDPQAGYQFTDRVTARLKSMNKLTHPRTMHGFPSDRYFDNGGNRASKAGHHNSENNKPTPILSTSEVAKTCANDLDCSGFCVSKNNVNSRVYFFNDEDLMSEDFGFIPDKKHNDVGGDDMLNFKEIKSADGTEDVGDDAETEAENDAPAATDDAEESSADTNDKTSLVQTEITTDDNHPTAFKASFNHKKSGFRKGLTKRNKVAPAPPQPVDTTPKFSDYGCYAKREPRASLFIKEYQKLFEHVTPNDFLKENFVTNKTSTTIFQRPITGSGDSSSSSSTATVLTPLERQNELTRICAAKNYLRDREIERNYENKKYGIDGDKSTAIKDPALLSSAKRGQKLDSSGGEGSEKFVNDFNYCSGFCMHKNGKDIIWGVRPIQPGDEENSTNPVDMKNDPDVATNLQRIDNKDEFLSTGDFTGKNNWSW